MPAAHVFARAALDRHARAVRGGYEDALAALVEVPGVSADPSRAADVRRCAEAAAALVRDLGGQADVIETRGRARVAHRAVPLHAAGRPLPRAWHHRRQGAGARRALRRRPCGRRRRPRQRARALGVRGGDRLSPLRADVAPRAAPPGDRSGRRVGHGVGVATPARVPGGTARAAGVPPRARPTSASTATRPAAASRRLRRPSSGWLRWAGCRGAQRGRGRGACPGCRVAGRAAVASLSLASPSRCRHPAHRPGSGRWSRS